MTWRHGTAESLVKVVAFASIPHRLPACHTHIQREQSAVSLCWADDSTTVDWYRGYAVPYARSAACCHDSHRASGVIVDQQSGDRTQPRASSQSRPARPGSPRPSVDLDSQTPKNTLLPDRASSTHPSVSVKESRRGPSVDRIALFSGVCQCAWKGSAPAPLQRPPILCILRGRRVRSARTGDVDTGEQELVPDLVS